MELLIILLLLIANGVFAMAEIAIVSARKTRLHQWANEGDARARVALELANAPNQILSTTQIGITLVGIFAGAFGGATLADGLAGVLRQIPALAPYSKPLAFGLVVLAITYLSLIIGELVPKRLALHNPERVAAAMAGPMRKLSRITLPVVHLLSFSTDLVLRLFGLRPSEEPPVTEEEIKVLLQQGAAAGVFQESEEDMVAGVFRLSDRRVSLLMTPRSEIVWLDVEDSPEEIRRKITERPYSRFPVCRDTLDHVLGMVHTRDMLAQLLNGQPLGLQSAMQPALFIHESKPAAELLEQFKQTGKHDALVIDEYGVLQGLVTMTDIVEEIVGDIEPAEPQAVQRDDGSWLLDGMLPVDELATLMALKELPGARDGDFQTLGGFVLVQLGRIPRPGDHFVWDDWRFEVVDMDGHRIDKVLVSREEGERAPHPAGR